jgi:thiaminase/transcriptional activator TenA
VAKWLRDKIDLWAKTAGIDEKLRMESHFVISSRYEWMFWEMAWTEEKWPV